jgi:peptidoglycan/xylan/chitin deacetylase (PgdA/CDA1 family)
MLGLSCSAAHNRSVRPPKIMLVPLVMAAMVTPAEAHARPVEPPAPRPDRTVSLTFDDGPAPDWTPAVLAVLRRRHVQATFCMLGDNAARHPALARQIVTEGHRVCNHSRSHADLARLSDAGVREQVLVAQQQIRRATGRTPRDFRFPYGSSDRAARRIVQGYGLRIVSWDVDPTDWTRPRSGTITTRIVGAVRPGSVVLMHDGGGDRGHTAASLDATITRLRDRGYRFVVA